jgi:hypothetical protein
MARINSQAGSSGLQRTLSMPGVASSHDSASGFVTGPSTGDRDIMRTELEGEVVKGWNTCPGGCGCKCRSVIIVPNEGKI